MAWIIYLCLGALAGLLAGLFGVGGGAIIVPILIFVFSAQGFAVESLVHLAVGTSFATIVVTSLSSVHAHHQQSNVNWFVFRNMAPGLIVGVLMGGFFAAEMSGKSLRLLIGLFLCAVSIQMFFALQPKAVFGLPSRMGQLLVGGVVGGVSAFFGIGGGSLTVPFLSACRVSMRNAVATSAACGLPIAVFGALMYAYQGAEIDGLPDFASGYIYWPAFVGIAIASTPFANL